MNLRLNLRLNVRLSLCMVLFILGNVNGLSWYKCPLFTYVTNVTNFFPAGTKKTQSQTFFNSAKFPFTLHEYPIHGVGDQTDRSQCAMFKAPLDYSNENSSLIDIFVKKYRAINENPSKNLWLLMGGPGDSIAPYIENLIYYLSAVLNDVDIYAIEHRGVGYSTRLGCMISQAETPGSDGGVNVVESEYTSCFTELQNLTGSNNMIFSSFMTADNAARDLDIILNATKDNKDVYAYGVSYGTMWLQRYLLLFPHQLKGAILDGTVTQAGPPGVRLTIDGWDKYYNEVAMEYLQLCRNDSFCSTKLVDDPSKFISQLYQDVFRTDNQSTCTAISKLFKNDKAVFRETVGPFFERNDKRHLIPALLYRLRRCNDDDVQVFFHLLDVQKNDTKAQSDCLIGPNSQLLPLNILGSECWDTSRTREDLQRDLDATFITTPLSLSLYDQLFGYRFPTYSPDPKTFNQTFTTNTTSILMMNGDLDPQTPLHFTLATLEALKANRTRNVTFVLFPGAPHGTAFFTPDHSNIPCATRVMASFISSSTNSLDTSCISNLLPVDFRGTSAVNLKYLGVDDAYDGAPSSSSSSSDISATTFWITIVSLGFVFVVEVVVALRYKRRYHSDDYRKTGE